MKPKNSVAIDPFNPGIPSHFLRIECQANERWHKLPYTENMKQNPLPGNAFFLWPMILTWTDHELRSSAHPVMTLLHLHINK